MAGAFQLRENVEICCGASTTRLNLGLQQRPDPLLNADETFRALLHTKEGEGEIWRS